MKWNPPDSPHHGYWVDESKGNEAPTVTGFTRRLHEYGIMTENERRNQEYLPSVPGGDNMTLPQNIKRMGN